ncbi:hypothetical protein BDR07DRAFT_278728 [Suillus spraguei]|nr:hypothetical protein BDR07DRAFT_278728 [Suillus spraguei]
MVPNVLCMVFCQHEYLDVRLDSRFSCYPLNHSTLCRFSTGTVGPAFFSLGVKDSLIIIVIVDWWSACCLHSSLFSAQSLARELWYRQGSRGGTSVPLYRRF